MTAVWRLLIHPAGTPSWNMAVDEALLRCHADSGKDALPVLRFYTWNPPALSLGYFQRKDGIDWSALERLGIQPVRRLTGGRAVLHWEDFTYSVVAEAGKDTPIELKASYLYLCRGLLEAFSSLGIEAGLGSEERGLGRLASCFAVAAPSDITWQGRKFVGSAQTRIGTSLLQHGSILLRPQGEILQQIFRGRPHAGNAPDNTGDNTGQVSGDFPHKSFSGAVVSIEEILGRVLNFSTVAEAVRQGFEKALGIKLVEDELSPAEKRLAGELESKYLALRFLVPLF